MKKTIFVEVENRPDYDYALGKALEKYKETENEYDELWGNEIFVLIGVVIEDNYKEKIFNYKFEVRTHEESVHNYFKES